jgi:Ribosomal protein L30p/L7e
VTVCALLMQSRKILQLLRLRQIHNGVFVKVRHNLFCLAGPLVLCACE